MSCNLIASSTTLMASLTREIAVLLKIEFSFDSCFVHEMPLKITASQGQRKSFLFGIKFAQFEILKANTNTTPLLLLDDIFEKLDEKRGEKLIQFISNQDTQVFITDTHIERLQKAFANTERKVQWIEL